MAETNGCHSFCNLPEDVQLSILSFLPPEEVANFSRTSKRFSDLYRNERSLLWRSLCDRRWGHLTSISAWGKGKISYKFLYRTLCDWDDLPGFWRQWTPQSQNSARLLSNPSTLMVLEWGPWFISGSIVSPAEGGTYEVVTTPFLWIWITSHEEFACYLDTEARVGKPSDAFATRHLLPVYFEYTWNTHLRFGTDRTINHKQRPRGDGGARFDSQDTSQIYEYYANRMLPVRQKKREKHPQRWETEHFLKIVDASPTSARPLQGLWKGINEEMKLEFYLVTYDVLGLSCRKISDLSGGRLEGCKPVFWTGDATLLKAPLSPEDALLYESRIHISTQFYEPVTEAVTHYMVINSSYDLVLCGLTDVFRNLGQVEGMVWVYGGGNFGFSFLRDDFIVDLRRISTNGFLADVSVCRHVSEPCG